MPAKLEELGNLLEQCARELPAGYRIDLSVEYESGWVNLVGPDGNIEYPSNHEYGLAADVADALEYAKTFPTP